jgi:uncharacterized protein
MRWRNRRQSSNIEDRRGKGTGKFIGGGLTGIVFIVIYLIMGGNPTEILDSGGGNQTGEYRETEQENELRQFVSVVLAETEDTWTQIFSENNADYQKPVLVLYTGRVQSACGISGSAAGPFYCPGDQKLYIDLSFYEELKRQFNAPGDFAMAYVVAHEVGHHVQNLMGITDQMASLRQKLSEEEYNQYSVRLELQADFFAGVWAHHASRIRGLLEEGDIEEALTAASAIGDDNIQKRTQGYTVPESFTHGTSQQRMRWFKKGYQTGDIEQGNTFEADNL